MSDDPFAPSGPAPPTDVLPPPLVQFPQPTVPPGFINPACPSPADWLTFVRTYMQIPPVYLPDNSLWLEAAYNIAIAEVWWLLNRVSPLVYTLAVYNYAADRLLNIALDQPGQCYFTDLRRTLGLGGLGGVVQSSADQGTSQSLLVPDWAKTMTVTQLDQLKTPYGRMYLGLAQDLGVTIWGLS